MHLAWHCIVKCGYQCWKWASSHIWSNYCVISTDNSELQSEQPIICQSGSRSRKAVHQWCNLSPCPFKILSKQVMRRALQLRICRRFQDRRKTISNLRYADNIVLVAASPEELQDLVNRVDKVAMEYNMFTNATKKRRLWQMLAGHWRS